MAKFIAWDLDGVLVDTDKLHYEVLNRALTEYGIKPITEEEHHKTYKGLPTQIKLDMMAKEGRPIGGRAAVINEAKQRHTLPAILQTVTPNSRAIKLLQHLRANGFQMGVCSNCIKQSVSALCAKADLTAFMRFMLSTEDVKKGKPDPEMYIQAASIFGIDPGDMIVVEDGEPGKESARQAGCRLVEVDGPQEVGMGQLLTRIIEASKRPSKPKPARKPDEEKTDRPERMAPREDRKGRKVVGGPDSDPDKKTFPKD